MMGFKNGVVYADNINLSSAGEFAANGQLLIGSTIAPHVRLATLIAGSNVTITNGNGTITIASTGGGGGGVTSVSGTANRITSSGGATPVIDIDATYVGQASITTLGTVATGTWQATTVGTIYGGTGLTSYTTGDTLYASASNTLSKLAIGNFGDTLSINNSNVFWQKPLNTLYFYDDFIAFEQSPWSINNVNSGSTARNTAAVSGHPGLWTLNTNANSAGGTCVHTMETGVMVSDTQVMFEWVVRIPTLSDGTDTYTVRIGLGDNFNPAESTNAIYFRYTHSVNSGDWVGVCRNGGAESVTNTTSTVGTSYTRLTIVVVPGTPLVTFYVDGSSVGTVNTNVPTGNPMGMHASIVKSAGTNNRSLITDYGYLVVQLASNR